MADNRGVSIEHAYLATYPEADCTKIHVYVKNTGKFPVFLDGIWHNDTWLDLDVEKWAVKPGTKSAGGHGLEHAKSDIRRKTRGIFQWHRALPNPVEPGRVTDVCVSLWGRHKQARIRIKVRGGGMLEWQAKEQARTLRLSHIAFDPSNPNKLYVYVENKTKQDIAIDHLRVNTEIVREMKTIPAGNAIEAGKKTCVIIHPKKKLPWGSYCGVGVVGKGSEQVTAVVRVINYFPIGSWSVDTRPEMFFDSIDLRKPMPNLTKKTDATDPFKSLALPAPTTNECPYQAYYDGRDPTCDKDGWEVNSIRIIRAMHNLTNKDRVTPYYTHICDPAPRAYALFGEMPDLVLLNPYKMLYRAAGPTESARYLRLARTWADPRPLIDIPEAFCGGRKDRDLTPEEVSFAMWNEIAEGVRGLRYFTKHVRHPGRGYSQIPGVEAQIARDSLNLQLLKNFLRIGDTFQCVSANKDTVVTKSILCGDKGIVLILLNFNYEEGGSVRARWTPVSDIRVCAHIPRGQHVRRVYEVRQGFRETAYTEAEQRLTFDLSELDTALVYLVVLGDKQQLAPDVRFEQATMSEHPRLQIARGVSTLGEISRMHPRYVTQIVRMASPLCQHPQQSDVQQVISIGEQLHRAKMTFLRQLSHLTDSATQQPPGQRALFSLELAGVYLAMGMPSKAEEVFRCISGHLPKVEKARSWSSLADMFLDAGEYDQGVMAFEAALGETENQEVRADILRLLLVTCQERGKDTDRAIRVAKSLVTLLEQNGRDTTHTRLQLASLCLAVMRPTEALVELDALGSGSRYNGRLPVNYLRGWSLMQLAKYQEAIACFRKAKANNEGDPSEIDYFVGQALLAQQLYGAAREQFAAVVARYPNSEYARKAKDTLSRLSKSSVSRAKPEFPPTLGTRPEAVRDH